MVGHHLHHTCVGHCVTVRTPGAVPCTGLLVSVGEDRLVVEVDGRLESVVRLLTTRLDRPE